MSPGLVEEDLYFGNQDNGSFATVTAGAAAPDWTNRDCCDVFSSEADPDRVVYDVCCFGGRRNRVFRRGPGMSGGSEISYPPSGLVPGFSLRRCPRCLRPDGIRSGHDRLYPRELGLSERERG